MASTLRSRTKPLVYAGTALAVAGVGSSIAAGTASASTAPRAASHANTSRALESSPLDPRAPANASVPALPSIAALTSGRHDLPLAPTMPAAHHAAVVTAAARASRQPTVVTWIQVRNAINRQTNPAAARLGQVPAADKLTPIGTSGPQLWMPMSPAQISNATAIVKQALTKKMGIRSAVIAVATAMQESRLFNLHYGDMDSLGLFQQRPSMGWGTAGQITDPSFAARAFLTALQQHQTGDPGWATQPLWYNAQAVQKSGFPFAYARWESQAAGLVMRIAMQLK